MISRSAYVGQSVSNRLGGTQEISSTGESEYPFDLVACAMEEAPNLLLADNAFGDDIPCDPLPGVSARDRWQMIELGPTPWGGGNEVLLVPAMTLAHWSEVNVPAGEYRYVQAILFAELGSLCTTMEIGEWVLIIMCLQYNRQGIL